MKVSQYPSNKIYADKGSSLRLGSADLVSRVRAGEAVLRKYIPEKLSSWAENRRGIVNELARSALIRCGDNRKPRRYFRNEQLFMLGEGALTYTGEELRGKDEDILITLSHCARNMPSGKMLVQITSSEICKLNGWRQDQRYYNDIFQSVQRMKGGVVTVFSRRLAKSLKCQRVLEAGATDTHLANLYDELVEFERTAASELQLAQTGEEVAGMMLSLISGDPIFIGAKSVKNGIPQGNLTWKIQLDKNLAALFARPYLTIVDFDIRQALSPNGRRLQAYFLSHKKPHPVKLRSLEKMLGLSIGDIAALKFLLTAGFEELKFHHVIADFTFVKSADGTDWVVAVKRHQATQND